MPRRGSTTGGTVSRRVLPFAPLALALLIQNATLPKGGGGETRPGPVSAADIVPTQCDDVADFQDCHERYPTGCTDSAKPNYDAYLNLFKNRMPPPDTKPEAVFSKLADFQALDRSLPKGLTRGNHGEFLKELGALGEGRVFGAVGYLYYAQSTGEESVNCKLGGAEDVDFHIGIGFDASLAEQVLKLTEARKKIPKELKKALQQKSIIIEMTPHYRFHYEPNWSIENLRPALGRQVKVLGQLMVDNEHNIRTQNCALPGSDEAKCWRGSAWELHPVTQFKVCKSAQPCAQDSTSWEDLDTFSPS